MLPTLLLSLLPVVLAGPLSATPTAPPYPERTVYPNCGGFSPHPGVCAEPAVCIPDPRSDPDITDQPGICVEPVFCGGFAAFRCEDGKECFDDPRDDCDVEHGGADCGGICI